MGHLRNRRGGRRRRVKELSVFLATENFLEKIFRSKRMERGEGKIECSKQEYNKQSSEKGGNKDSR